MNDPDFRQRMHFMGPVGFKPCTRSWPHDGPCAHPHDTGVFQPYADFESEQRWEQGGMPLAPNKKTIGVYVTDFVKADRYVTAAEARALAEALLDAAAADEGYDQLPDEEKWYP